MADLENAAWVLAAVIATCRVAARGSLADPNRTAVLEAAGLARRGLTVADRHAIEVDLTREGGYAAARTVAGSEGLELVFAVSDVLAIGVMSGLRDAGLVPGRDLAVAGFDDIAAAVDVVPALTSVAVALHDLGRRALSTALGDAPATVVTIPADVVLRESTPATRPYTRH